MKVFCLRPASAGLLVIGNELLRGQTADANTLYLLRDLRRLGIWAAETRLLRDDVRAIAQAVRTFTRLYDLVIIAGGMGPTHDDVTLEGVARGLKRRRLRHQALASRLAHYAKHRLETEHLARFMTMADLPEGADVIFGDHIPVPICGNCVVLPGVPKLLVAGWSAVATRFEKQIFSQKSLWIGKDEASLATLLDETQRRHPAVQIGSYPHDTDGESRVKIVVESREVDPVLFAIAELADKLEPWLIGDDETHG